jgi:hypothetical protein
VHSKSHTFTQSNNPTLIIPIGEGGLIVHVGFSEGDTKKILYAMKLVPPLGKHHSSWHYSLKLLFTSHNSLKAPVVIILPLFTNKHVFT